MLPTPMLASLSTDKAIEMLNNAESVPGREEITISADLDKFYVNRENNEIQWVYYNPDSSAGGQLVYNFFSFDKLREAFSQNENAPLDVIAEDCQQFLVDKGTPEFIVSARHFLNSSCDFTNEDKNFHSELRALTLKIGDVVQFQHSRSGEPPQTLNAVVMRTSHKDAQYSSVRGYAFAMDAYDARDTAFSLSKGGFGFASALSFAREYKFEFAGNVEELRRKDHEQNVALYSVLEEHKTIALQFNSEPEKDGVIFKAKSAGYDNFRLKWFNEDIGEIEKGYVLIADREKAFDVPLMNYGELGERGAEALAFDLKKSGLAAYDFSLKEDANLQKQDKTFAYEVGHSAPFTVVHLDIGTAERKTAVSEALKNIIYNAFGERNDMSQPYKNLLEQIKPDTEFIHASEGHLSSLKYALRNAESNKELCISMLDSIKDAERNPEKTVVIKGYACLPKDAWEEHGVKFTIGQSVDDTSFYYARATDGKTTRDYEYDYKPDREKVISDHADKLAEEDIDRGEAIYGADGYLAFTDTELKHSVEHIPQQRDISHNTTNADLSAKRGESRGNIMEQSTKFEVSTMSKLDGDGPAKAIGTLIVNGEFAVHGIKVVDGKNGLYVAMPSEKRNGGYEDVVFPVTKEARAAIDSAVLGTYEKLAASPEATIKNDIVTPTKPVSTVYAQMHNVDSDKTQTKAAGQITIDKCFVVTGVKLNEGTNSEGQTKTFVAMPAKPNPTGGYDDVAHPITADFHSKVDKAVIASANNIGRYEYKGVKYAELGENPVTSKPLHPKFADKLMAQLDKAGIVYQAKCAETVVISVKAADKQTFDAAQKELTAKLNGKDKPQKKQEQTTGTQNHTH